MDYYEKYLKYKNKYKNLKNLDGGMKIIINDNVTRDSITGKQFENIFKYATNVEIVSVSSLTGFIFRITLPENITIFRSDIIDTDGNLMNLQTNMLPNTGVKLVDIIFKICIIQEYREPKINNYNLYKKISCTLKELTDEYYVQRKIYDTTTMNGGIPVCPDVISLLTFSNSKFNCLFIKDQSDESNLSNIFSANPVFQNINREVNNIHLRITRSVGIILMESVPSSYKQLKFLIIDSKPTELFIEMSKRVLANSLIIFFRSGIILLDAHLKNWMYDNCQPFNQFKIKAIDFGRVYDRNTDIDKIEIYTRKYFLKESIKKRQNFAVLMDHNSIHVKTVLHISNIMRDELIALNCLIKKNPDGKILWQPDCTPPINITISDTKVMQIDSCMILMHRIFVISAFIDYFHNMSKFGKNTCQMVDIFNILFRSRCSNINDMIKYNLNINLIEYLNYISPEAKEFTILSYMEIKEYVKTYLEPTPSRVKY